MILLAVAGLVTAACGDDPAETRAVVTAFRAEVVVETVARKPVASTLELPGNLMPRKRSIIVAEVDGVIESLPKPMGSLAPTPEQERHLASMGIDLRSDPLSLDLGDEVSEGAVLVELRPRDFELDLAAAEARSAKAKADLDDLMAWTRPEEIARLEARRDEVAAELANAKTELERATSLREGSMVSQGDYDRRFTEVRKKEAELAQARAQIELAEAGPTAAAIAVAKALVAEAESRRAIAEERLKKAVIRAPYDAVVTDRYADVGDRVTAMPRVEILEIMNLTPIIVQVGVPERFIGAVSLGDRVAVRAEGLQSPADGIVVLINDKVDYESRSFRTRIAIDNRDKRLKAGQFARVAFDLSSSSEALTVSSTALTYAAGRPRVFVYAGGAVHEREVAPGVTGGGRVEILSGLAAGEQVVVDDPSILADGMPVVLGTAAAGQ